jgi:hypothetical protein
VFTTVAIRECLDIPLGGGCRYTNPNYCFGYLIGYDRTFPQSEVRFFVVLQYYFLLASTSNRVKANVKYTSIAKNSGKLGEFMLMSIALGL